MAPSNPYGSAGYQQLGESSLVRTATPRTENSWGFDTVLAQCTGRYLSAPPTEPELCQNPSCTDYGSHPVRRQIDTDRAASSMQTVGVGERRRPRSLDRKSTRLNSSH